MNMFRQEFYKSFVRWSFFGIVGITLFLNICFLWTRKNEDGIDAFAYRSAYNYIDSLPEVSQIEFILSYAEQRSKEENIESPLFTNDETSEMLLSRQLEKEALQLIEYPAYLENIQHQANQSSISIFSDVSDYSKENLAKTAEVFQKFEGTTLRWNNSQTFLEATEFVITDIFVIVLLFTLMSAMVITEREKGLFELLRCTEKGRKKLMLQKLFLIVILCANATLIFWGSNLGISIVKYGMLDFSAPIQTIYGYDGCGLQISVLGYLLLFYSYKCMVYIAIGVILLWLSIRVKHILNLYITVFLIVGIETALYYIVDGNSAWQLLHYINWIPLLNVNDVFRFFIHLKILQTPISYIVISFVVIAGIIFVFWIRNLQMFGSDKWSGRLKYRQTSWNKKGSIPTPNILTHEGYRLFIEQRGILLIILLIVIEVWVYTQKPTTIGSEEYYYKSYMQQLQGDVTEKTEQYISKEAERLQSFEQILSEAQTKYENEEISGEELNAVSNYVYKNTLSKSSFERVNQYYEYAREKDVAMVYDTGYLNLLGHGNGGKKEICIQILLILIFQVLLFANYFCIEYETGMNKIVHTLPCGRRKLTNIRIGIALGTTILLSVIVNIFDFLYQNQYYGFANWSEKVATIPLLATSIFAETSILGYLVIMYGIRLLFVLISMVVLIVVAKKRKHTMQVSAIILGMFGLPILLYILN